MKLLIIISLFLCVNIFSQTQPGWDTIDTTDVPVAASSGERIALFSNHYGIHLLKIGYTGSSQHVKYWRLKTTGELDAGFTSSGILIR